MFHLTDPIAGLPPTVRAGYAITAFCFRWGGFVCLGLAAVTGLSALVAGLDLEVSRGFADGFVGHDGGDPRDVAVELFSASIVVAATGFIALQVSRIVDSLRIGDPFEPANPRRLSRIALVLAGVCALRVFQHATTYTTSSVGRPDLSTAVIFEFVPWLLVILTAVLADVFSHGTRIRAENKETI